MAIVWTGSEATIPAGWHLCDGTLGTRDLRNRFIVGAGSSYAVAATGGAVVHGHTHSDSGHAHELDSGSSISAGGDFDTFTGAGEADVSDDEVSNLPPYFALCYIEKL